MVTLLSDGEVAVTYYYDAFGNILTQTGEADNAILYAGYQYDEETGLYYLNARMYDPVAARFLQADTYPGSLNDPLSLNRYTYCLNNPNRYTDPSGHFAVAAVLSAVAARVLIGLATGVVSAGMEAFSQKVLEKRSRIDYDLVLYEGVTGGILGAVFANGAGAGKAMARQAGKLTVKKAARTVGREIAIGALGGVVSETGRQVIMGTKRKDLNYGQIAAAGAMGGAFGGAGTAAGMGFEALKETRLVRSTLDGVNEMLGRGRRTVREAFAKLTGKNGGNVDLDALQKERVYKREVDSSNPFYKQGGGSDLDDFMSIHAQKHVYNPKVKSTKNKTQFGENIDVAKLREDTLLHPNQVIYDSEHNMIKYVKEYDFNISTSDTPTGSHRVFINLDTRVGRTIRNSQFPYYGGNK